jgi:hypothetical protein
MSKPPLRVVIVSTPRVGNTWINFCLADISKVTTLAAHRYTDLKDMELPEGLVLQVHASYQDNGFKQFIQENNLKVVTVARHPLDVLISMLRFVQVESSPLQWLDGTVGVETLYGVDPSQKKFIDWCLGEGAEQLLKISYDWAKLGQAYVVRYEDMLADPTKQMKGLLAGLGVKASSSDVRESLERFSPDFFKNLSSHHGWRATKDNWKNFFTKSDAQKIYKKYAKIFDYFHYDVSGAVNVNPKDNLTDWSIKVPKLTTKELYYNSMKELEVHNKRFVLDVAHKDREIVALKRALVQKDEEQASIRKRNEYLETKVWEYENQRLADRVKSTVEHGVRVAKRRASNAVHKNPKKK